MINFIGNFLRQIFVKFLFVENSQNRMFGFLVPNACWPQVKYIPKQSTSMK